MTRKFWHLLSLFTILALFVTACGSSTPTTAPTAGSAAAPSPTTVAEAPTTAPAPTVAPTVAATEAKPTDAPTEAVEPTATTAPSTGSTEVETPSAYAELVKAEAGEFKGKSVSIFSVYVDEDETRFKETIADFTKRTGIDVQYEGSRDFETLITVRVEGNNAPDIAVFPQPGLLATFARADKLIDLGPVLNKEQLSKDYIQSWIDLGTVDGTLYGAFFRASTKSLVWYPVEAFEKAGYKIPETWDELLALSDEIAATGSTPWCLGIEQAGATGWVATDWIEDIMLRTAGPEAYDKWVSHELPFNSPEVKNAAEVMAKIWFDDKYVYGGRTGILTIPVADTQTPMFEDPPACWLYRQAGWVPAFFPEGKEAGKDSNFFYLPPIDPAQGKPVLGGGDVYGAFSDRPEVLALVQYLATADSAKAWIQKGGFLSPNKSVPLEWYENEVDRNQADIIQSATVFRFDASDLMPAEVGTGTFWKGMVDWIGGAELDTILQEIDDSWPKN